MYRVSGMNEDRSMKTFSWKLWLWLGIALVVPSNGLLIWSVFEHGNFLGNPAGILGMGLTIIEIMAFRNAADQKDFIVRKK